MSKPPYEVSESGWGEFEIQIRIYFNDLTEKPVTMYHGLKLFHTNEAITSQALVQVNSSKKSGFMGPFVKLRCLYMTSLSVHWEKLSKDYWELVTVYS